MRLSDQVQRTPARAAIGLGRGSGTAQPFDVERAPDGIGLITQTGVRTGLPVASQLDAGLMAADDKAKLDGLANTLQAVDPSNFASRAQLIATDVDPGVQFVRTAGFAAPGDGGSALYVRRPVEPAHAGKAVSVDGAHWELIPEYGSVNTKQFGETGDGVADDTRPIQDAIDFALYHGANIASAQPVEVLIIGPRCRTTDTIHLGYGERTFHGLSVRGTTCKRRAQDQNAGTAIVADFVDRPIVNIQGARQTRLREIWLHGKLDFSDLDPLSHEILSDAYWDAKGGDARHTPYAAIAIDAYSGPAPQPAYPAVAYPAFLGSVTQYDKLTSSEVRIEHVGIGNVNTAIAIQPGDSDANGDFVQLDTVTVEYCKFGVSIGNSQSRNVEIRNAVGLFVQTAFANGVHGRQRGRFGGPIDNCSFAGYLGRVFEFTLTAVLGPTTFRNLYAESVHQIGAFTSDSTVEGTLGFDDCHFAFRHTLAGQVPAVVLEGQNSSDLHFRNTRFTKSPSVYAFQPPNLRIDQCQVIPEARVSGPVPRYQAFAHNALAGGLLGNLLTLRPQRIRFKLADVDTGAMLADVTTEEDFYKTAGRAHCLPLGVWSFAMASEINGAPQRKRLPYFERLKTPGVHFSSISLSGRTLVLEFLSLDDDDAMRLGVLPGDVIRDRQTGMVFFITARSGTEVTAEAQTNYRTDGAGTVQMVPFETGTGALQFANARLYGLSYLTLGDSTAGSDTMTGVARADGASGHLAADIQPGDYLMADQDPDFVFANHEAEVVAVDAQAQTVTFRGAARNDAPRKALPVWIRQGAGNL